jgi:hypothetical protein
MHQTSSNEFCNAPTGLPPRSVYSEYTQPSVFDNFICVLCRCQHISHTRGVDRPKDIRIEDRVAKAQAELATAIRELAAIQRLGRQALSFFNLYGASSQRAEHPS